VLPPGYRLPPTRQLAADLGAHRNTVVRAYEELAAAGHTVSVVGRGTFVAEPARETSNGIPPERAPLPWGSLLARRTVAEQMRRAERLERSPALPDTVDLASLQPSPDLRPHEPLRRCLDHVLKEDGALSLGYAPGSGVPELRELLADELQRMGVPASADEIVVTTGSQQGLDLLARALVDPGDTFLVEDVTYAGAIQLLSAAGARLVGVPSDAEGPDLEELGRWTRATPKGFYVMPNFRNPTGAAISTRRREALVRWAHDAGVPLVEDDYDADLQLDDQPVPAPLRALDAEVCHIGTFSKKLLPALRVGYLVCPAALRERIVELKSGQDLGTSRLLQLALAEFLRRGYLRAHLKRVVPEYRARRDALEGALAEHLPPEFAWRHSGRGLFLWLPLPAQLPSETLYEEARRQGVLVSPGLLNRVSSRAGDGVRLSFCNESPRRLGEGARRLGRAVRALSKRPRPAAAGQEPHLDVI
jgi:GntR family transcriptional regulator/MocR family aminotransferase